MSRGEACARLAWHFVRDVVLGGWATARLILAKRVPEPGLARLAYADLPEEGVAWLGALICLTPGTTTVGIDTERRELLLHLLDAESAEATLAALQRDFVEPMAAVYGGRP